MREEKQYCCECGEKFDTFEMESVEFVSTVEWMCFECYKAKVMNEIKKTAGKIFFVEFVKKDGSIRKMLARTGVKKGINGNGHSLKEETKNHVIRVYDMMKQAWRTITYDKVIRFSGNKIAFELN